MSVLVSSGPIAHKISQSTILKTKFEIILLIHKTGFFAKSAKNCIAILLKKKDYCFNTSVY